MKFAQELRQVQRDSRTDYNKYLTELKNICLDSAKKDYDNVTISLIPTNSKKDIVNVNTVRVTESFFNFVKDNRRVISDDTGLNIMVFELSYVYSSEPNKATSREITIKWDKDYYKY